VRVKAGDEFQPHEAKREGHRGGEDVPFGAMAVIVSAMVMVLASVCGMIV
jgi:hypothetical protein